MDEPEQTMMRYLLGELSEQEQAALEEKYFTDPQVFDQMLKTESELVDGYVRGYLPAEVRDRFEKSYMTRPRLSERVNFARALTTRLDQLEEAAAPSGKTPSITSGWERFLTLLRGQRSALAFSMALAVMLVALGGVWFFIESQRRQERETAQAQAAREAESRRQRAEAQQDTGTREIPEESVAKGEPSPGAARQAVSPSPTVSSAPQSVSLALTVGGVRGGESNRMPTLVIPQGTAQARLLLVLKDNNYPGYQASLERVGGTEIFSRTGVKPGGTKSGASFVFIVPASKFASGDYILTLKGVSPNGEADDLGKSLFRVEKR